jgi:hypothetical protein
MGDILDNCRSMQLRKKWRPNSSLSERKAHPILTLLKVGCFYHQLTEKEVRITIEHNISFH